MARSIACRRGPRPRGPTWRHRSGGNTPEADASQKVSGGVSTSVATLSEEGDPMGVDRSYVAGNDTARARLKALVAGMSDAQLGHPMPAGWTVAGVLAGPAFRRAASACTGGPHGEHPLWTVVGSPRLTHHNASIQVFAEGEGGSRVVWVADLRPHGVADTIRRMIEQGMALMKKTLEK